MATGTYQDIVPYDLEFLRSGIIPLKEAATVTAKRGGIGTINSSGFVAEAAASFTTAFCVLAEDGHNASGTGTNIQAWPILSHQLYEITLNEAWAQNLTNTVVGLVKDGTTGKWYGSTANAGGQFLLLWQVPTWAVGDTKSRVIGRFLSSYIQSPQNALQPGLGTALASAATIAPTNQVHHVTGTTTVNTITAPGGIQSGNELVLIADGTFSVSTAGNVADRVDLVAGQTARLVYDVTTAKWYASAVPTVAPTAITADGAITPSIPRKYAVTKAGVAAMTLAAPTVTTDDGVVIVVSSNTANAHTITATGLLQTGTASVNVATFAASAGAGVTLMAYQGKWNVLASVGITFS